MPYFIKSENNSDESIVSLNPEYHGSSGPLRVTSVEKRTFLYNAVIRASNEMGIPYNPDFNGPRQFGVTAPQQTIKNGLRASAGNTYIDPNPYPNNLHILANSLVSKVLFNKINGKVTAIGVEFIRNDKKYKVYVKKEVIISAGNSRQILKQKLYIFIYFIPIFRCNKFTTNSNAIRNWSKRTLI